MDKGVAVPKNGAKDSVLLDCLSVVRSVAAYRFPPAMDRRLLWLSEHKELLTSDEREELLALVELAQDRTLDKVHARAILQQVEKRWPELVVTQP
jgi:hypothetical protein